MPHLNSIHPSESFQHLSDRNWVIGASESLVGCTVELCWLHERKKTTDALVCELDVCCLQGIWSRALGLPIERPKSVTMDVLEKKFG